MGECMAPMTKSKQASRPGPSRPRWGNCKMWTSCTYFCVAPMERRKKGVSDMLYTRTGSRWTSRGATSRARR